MTTPGICGRKRVSLRNAEIVAQWLICGADIVKRAGTATTTEECNLVSLVEKRFEQIMWARKYGLVKA